MPMEHLQLSHQQVHWNRHEDEIQDTIAATTATGDSLHDSSHSIAEYSISVSVPSFILEYRINGTTPPSTNDFETVESHTRIFITEQLEKRLNRRGIGLAEKSFASIWGRTNKSADSVEIVFVPVFLFDSTWSNVPSEVDLDKFLITMFSGQPLEEYLSSLSMLDTAIAFAATRRVVFRRSQESKINPDEKESMSSPYFAGACAGIITLLILFLWNQSMRVRSLMKRKAKGIETETPTWNRRRCGGGCEDEEHGSFSGTNNGNQWGAYRDDSNSDSDSSSDESLIEEASRSPLFQCPPELEGSSVGSSSTNESTTVKQILKQSNTQCNRRCDAPSKCASSGSCAKMPADDSSPQGLSPCKKGPLNSISGNLYDYEGPESTRTSDKVSENGSSCCSSDKSYEVETSNSFEQLSSLENGHSTLDAIFGTAKDSEKSKERKKSIQRCDKSLPVMECDSSRQQSRFEIGQLSKESTLWAQDGNKRHKQRSGMSRGDCDSCSNDSFLEKAFDSGSELGGSAVDSDEKEEVVSTSIQECSPSGEWQESAIVAIESSTTQKTRLHAWLINQGQHSSLFFSNIDGVMERHTNGTKQILPTSVDDDEKEYCVNTPIGSGCGIAKDKLGYRFQYDNRRVRNTWKVGHGNRTNGKTRNVARNRKTRPNIDYKSKSNCNRLRAMSPEPRITEKDSFYRGMETQASWTPKRISGVNGGQQHKKNCGLVMDQESHNSTSKPLEEVTCAAAACLQHTHSVDPHAGAKDLDIKPKIDPQSLLQELKQHLTTRNKEGKATKRVPPRTTGTKKVYSNILVHELKEELSRRKLAKNKAIRVPSKIRGGAGGRSNCFIDELKARLASRAVQVKSLEPIPVDEHQIVARASGGLIHELKLALSNREKRVVNYDFTAAESKDRSRASQNESKLLMELRKKIADRHQEMYGRDDSIITDVTPSQSSADAEELAASIAVDDEQQPPIEETTMERSSVCHDSRSTETTDTVDHLDLDGNMSTISELGEHSAAFTNPTHLGNQHLGDCDNEKIQFPLVVTTRTAVRHDGNTLNFASGRREDPFKELSRLNQILESDSDTESILKPLEGANEAIASILDTEAGLEGNSKYPWKGVGDGAKSLRSRQNQMLVFDFVAPGKTPTDSESNDVDLLSRYKDDILKERMKLQSIDRSVNGDQSISSMPSYKARLFPTKKEKPESIPWWLPDETDSSTSLSETGKHDCTIHESGHDSSLEDDDISNASSSYDATNSTRSSFLTNILKQQ